MVLVKFPMKLKCTIGNVLPVKEQAKYNMNKSLAIRLIGTHLNNVPMSELDQEAWDYIRKELIEKKETENKIDSIKVELQGVKEELQAAERNIERLL